jgi:hypothetical protein
MMVMIRITRNNLLRKVKNKLMCKRIERTKWSRVHWQVSSSNCGKKQVISPLIPKVKNNLLRFEKCLLILTLYLLISFTDRFINIWNGHLSRIVIPWYKNVLRFQLNFYLTEHRNRSLCSLYNKRWRVYVCVYVSVAAIHDQKINITNTKFHSEDLYGKNHTKECRLHGTIALKFFSMK